MIGGVHPKAPSVIEVWIICETGFQNIGGNVGVPTENTVFRYGSPIIAAIGIQPIVVVTIDSR